MPCPHKFAKDLNLDKLTFAPTTLIIGTFNPGWDNLGNYAPWFYGRTQNNYFWEILPKLYGQAPLRQAAPPAWKAFCQTYRIALTDLIAGIDDADIDNVNHVNLLKSYRDDAIARHFKQICWVNVVNLLQQHSSITNVYLTRQVNTTFWRQPWQPVEAYCRAQGIKSDTLLTPSASARFQMPKTEKLSLGEFLLSRWRQDWHEI